MTGRNSLPHRLALAVSCVLSGAGFAAIIWVGGAQLLGGGHGAMGAILGWPFRFAPPVERAILHLFHSASRWQINQIFAHHHHAAHIAAWTFFFIVLCILLGTIAAIWTVAHNPPEQKFEHGSFIKHSRGREIWKAQVERVEYLKKHPHEIMEKTSKVPAPLVIGNFKIPPAAEYTHFAIPGTTGGGKTQVFNSLLCGLFLRRAHGHRAIVIDPGCRFLPYFYAPGDLILNPYDKRTVKWNPIAEVRQGPYLVPDAMRMAYSMYPPRGGSEGDTWRRHARTFLYSLLRKISEHGGTLRDLIELLTFESRAQELADLLADTPASIAFGADAGKFLASCKSVLIEDLIVFAELDLAVGAEGWSVGKWVRGEYPNTNGTFLWLTAPHGMVEAVQPIISTAYAEAVHAAVARPKGAKPLYVHVDEYTSVGPIYKIDKALTEGRQANFRSIMGFQGISQLREIHGNDGAQTLMSCARTDIIMAQHDHETAEYWSKHIGEQEVLDPQAGESESAGDGRSSSGKSVTHVRRTQRVQTSTQLQRGKNLRAFITLPEDVVVYEVDVPYIQPLLARVTQGHILRTPPPVESHKSAPATVPPPVQHSRDFSSLDLGKKIDHKPKDSNSSTGTNSSDKNPNPNTDLQP